VEQKYSAESMEVSREAVVSNRKGEAYRPNTVIGGEDDDVKFSITSWRRRHRIVKQWLTVFDWRRASRRRKQFQRSLSMM